MQGKQSEQGYLHDKNNYKGKVVDLEGTVGKQTLYSYKSWDQFLVKLSNDNPDL